MPDPKNYVLWGSAGHAKVLWEIVGLRGGVVVAIFDNNEVKPALPNVPLYVGESEFLHWINQQDHPREVAGLVAIGGSRGLDRLYIQALFRQTGLTIPVLVHPSAVVSLTASLGEGSQILALANVAADTRMGEACIINHRASVDHECELGNGVHVAPGATLCGCVAVADNVFIGANSVVLPRVSIGAGSIIGAGSVVTHNIPSGVVVIGNPAKILRST